MKVYIFEDKEWEHIKKDNKKARTIRELVKSLYNNPCNICRSFWLRLYAMQIGFLVQRTGNEYVLNKKLEEAIKNVKEL